MAEIKFHYLNALPQNPNSKELYFIKDTSNNKGKLYRGSQLIAETSAAEIENLANNVATALEAIQQGYETKTDATAKLTEAKEYTDDAIGKIPSASTTTKGIVKLSDVTNSTSTSLAATANAVKQAYDLANKTNVDKGSATQPVYFDEGVPVAISYTIKKSVPSDAKFTDTTYTNATSSKDGLMSAADKNKVDNISTIYETKADAATKLSEVKQYTDDAKEASIKYTDDMINAIVGEGAVETLDTIGEISQAIEENQDILDTLNEAIGKKANQTDLTNHIDNKTVHITANERDSWNNTLENAKKYTNETLTSYYTKTELDTTLSGKSDTGHKHVTTDITDLIIDSELSSNSTNPVQNKIIATHLEEIETDISNLSSNVAYIDENDNETIEISVDLTTLASLVGGDV